MATSLPQVTIARSGTGWLTHCHSCGATTWHARRPAADRDAHEHRKGHGARERED